MNSALRNFGAHILHGAGYYSARRRVDARRGRRLLVLMYHDIIDDEARGHTLDEDSPSASEFAAHIDAAVQNFRVVALADAVREIRNGGLREDSVAITFDDGYASIHRNALPVLKRYDVPSTLFVLTGWIGGMTFWWHRLRGIFTQATFGDLNVDALARVLGAPPGGFNGGSPETPQFRVSLAQQTESHLRDMEDQQRDAAIDRLSDLLLGDAVEAPVAATALSWTQIQEMVKFRVDLGAHTVSHVNLRYADAQTVGEEILRSRAEITLHTECSVTGFAYPYGKDLEHYRAFEDQLRINGYEYACTAVSGNNFPASNLYSLRRVTPPSTRSAALIDHALCQAFIRDNSFYDMLANPSGR